MVKRIALIVSSLSAALVLAAGLAWAGYGPQASVAAEQEAAAADPAGAVAALLVPWEAGTAAALAPVVQVEEEIVYIEPAPTPKTIRVVRKAAAVSAGSRAVRSSGDDHQGRGHDGEYEDEDEDEHEDEDEDEDEHEEREHEREDD